MKVLKLFVRKELLVDGIETSYLEAGQGQPLVLLHGGEFGGEAEICWEHNIPALAEHFRVLAPDLLGFGQTAKLADFVDGRMRRLRHLAQFIELAGAEGAACIGNSMGGMLLMFDAASDTPLIKASKLVTIAGAGALHDNEHVKALFDYDGSVDAMKLIVKALFHNEKWVEDQDYVQRRLASSLAPGAWEAVAAARFRRPNPLPPSGERKGIAFEKISADVLVIAGACDKLKPYGWWDELTGQIPNCSFALVEEAGHCPQIEQPAQTNAILLDFLLGNQRGSLTDNRREPRPVWASHQRYTNFPNAWGNGAHCSGRTKLGNSDYTLIYL